MVTEYYNQKNVIMFTSINDTQQTKNLISPKTLTNPVPALESRAKTYHTWEVGG